LKKKNSIDFSSPTKKFMKSAFSKPKKNKNNNYFLHQENNLENTNCALCNFSILRP